jgi:hypothetical protein
VFSSLNRFQPRRFNGYASLAALVEEQVNQTVAIMIERFSATETAGDAKGANLPPITLPGTGLDWLFVVFVKCLMLNKLFFKAETDHVSPLKQSRTFN